MIEKTEIKMKRDLLGVCAKNLWGPLIKTHLKNSANVIKLLNTSYPKLEYIFTKEVELLGNL